LVENPDILATLSVAGPNRPDLVIGFAAETHDVEANARAKLERKRCDWIVANDVHPAHGVMGGDDNALIIVRPDGIERMGRQPKTQAAEALARRIAAAMQ
jgi:phosphopantothenoylcysteine decarboxylase/phosphopantothenate--cysteine ligase